MTRTSAHVFVERRGKEYKYVFLSFGGAALESPCQKKNVHRSQMIWGEGKEIRDSTSRKGGGFGRKGGGQDALHLTFEGVEEV